MAGYVIINTVDGTEEHCFHVQSMRILSEMMWRNDPIAFQFDGHELEVVRKYFPQIGEQRVVTVTIPELVKEIANFFRSPNKKIQEELGIVPGKISVHGFKNQSIKWCGIEICDVTDVNEDDILSWATKLVPGESLIIRRSDVVNAIVKDQDFFLNREMHTIY